MTGRDVAAPAVAETQSQDRARPLLLMLGLAALLLAAPFALNLAGDAQVHLAIAEAFAAGRPFQFNPGGEIVVASTSPFWTMLLALYFRLAGAWTPVLLALTAVLFWLAAGYVLFRAGRDLWGLRGVALAGVVLLWLGHTTIVANALGGLENVAAALQLLLLYYALAEPRPTEGPMTARRYGIIGLLLGWALLTRPDSGLLALLLVALALPLLWPSLGGRRSAVGGLIFLVLVALAVVLPWFAYQYTLTGSILTDSSIARLYNGRMGALPLIPGLLYLHPKALVSLATAFLPLAAGFLVTTGALAGRFIRPTAPRLTLYCQLFPQVAAVLLVSAGVLFYTFVVGAEAFGRYFLPLFPFFFLAGVSGLMRCYDRLAALGYRRPAVILLVLAALFLAATGALDAYRRLGPGRYAPQRALDVIYGPANRRYYAANVSFLVAAPPARAALTDDFLADLGAPPTGDVGIAVTEVQLRYFLDERVTVLSLDGRTSAGILAYVDPAGGVPDFERYFLDARPDYVHANQWCAVGGWLAGVWPSAIAENLVCVWEQRAATMALGDSFLWQGRPVTLVAPEILRIDWEQ